MEQTDNYKRGGGKWGLTEEGKGLVKKHMHDPWTCTMVRGLSVEVGSGLVAGGEGGKSGTTAIA